LAKPGEAIVKQYLEERGLTVEKIKESDIKTADFAVFLGGKLVFYLEEKTLELTPPVFQSIDPVYNTIANHIHEAIKQFKSVNPDREVPNVLSFTNMDPAKDINYLFSTLTGHVITASGKLRWINKIKHIKDDMHYIDLYLWFDHDRGLSGHIWEEENSTHQEMLSEILGLQN